MNKRDFFRKYPWLKDAMPAHITTSIVTTYSQDAGAYMTSWMVKIYGDPVMYFVSEPDAYEIAEYYRSKHNHNPLK